MRLVTGGGGFIGSHLVDALLARGERVRVLDNFSAGRRANLKPNNALVIVEGDIRDLEACRLAATGCDGIYHQAALGSVPRSVADPRTTHEVNATGTLNVFLAAKDAGMTCVAVPDPLLTGDPRYRRADLILPSLTALTEPLLRSLTQ